MVITPNVLILYRYSNMKTDTQVLADLLEREQQSSRSVQWEDSPFKALVPQVSIKRIGSIFERFVIELCQLHSVEHCKPMTTEYDIVIKGKRIEVKGCTLGVNGTFTANQIRPGQEYDYVLLVCLSPLAVHYHLFTKQEAIVISKPQHSGASGLETLKAIVPQDYTYRRSESFLEAIQGIV